MMSESSRTIRGYVNRNYGDVITVDEPVYYENDKFWIAELKSDYPRKIHDDRQKESFTKFLMLRNLGDVKLTADNHITGTPRIELIQRLKSRLQQWQEIAQRIVLTSSAEELAQLGALKDSISPIVVLVRFLASKGNHEVSNAEVEAARISKKWIDFLIQAQLLERTTNGFTYSPLFTSLESEVLNKGRLESETLNKGRDIEAFVNHVIAYIMKNHYSFIRHVFKIWRFETYLHTATCYYAMSIQANQMLYLTTESLLSFYHKRYSKSYSIVRFESNLHELKNQHVLSLSDKYWYGSDDIWKRLKPLISTIPEEITSRRA